MPAVLDMQQMYDMWLDNRNRQSGEATATPAPSAVENKTIIMPTDYPEPQVGAFSFVVHLQFCMWNSVLKTPPLTKKCPLVSERPLLPSVRQAQ